jgi:hypothetical protein
VPISKAFAALLITDRPDASRGSPLSFSSDDLLTPAYDKGRNLECRGIVVLVDKTGEIGVHPKLFANTSGFSDWIMRFTVFIGTIDNQNVFSTGSSVFQANTVDFTIHHNDSNNGLWLKGNGQDLHLYWDRLISGELKVLVSLAATRSNQKPDINIDPFTLIKFSF